MVDGLTEVCNECVIGIRSPCCPPLVLHDWAFRIRGFVAVLQKSAVPSAALYPERSSSCEGLPDPTRTAQITIPSRAGFPLFLRAPLSASGLIRTGWSDREKSSVGPCPCLLVLFLHPRRRPGVLPPKIFLPVERRGRRTLSWIVHGAILQNYQVSAVGHHGVEAGLAATLRVGGAGSLRVGAKLEASYRDTIFRPFPSLSLTPSSPPSLSSPTPSLSFYPLPYSHAVPGIPASVALVVIAVIDVGRSLHQLGAARLACRLSPARHLSILSSSPRVILRLPTLGTA